MFDAAPSDQLAPGSSSARGLALQLPADAYWQLIHTLRLTLPPSLDDSPEALLRRDHAAIARIAALVPANSAEADLAAQFVAASEQWKDCLRLAQDSAAAPEWAHKCRAQANSMTRQANSALRLLLRVQEARRKLEADNAAADRAAWTEHCAVGLMAEALSGSPARVAAQPCPPPEPESPNAPVPRSERAPRIVSKNDPQSRITETETPMRPPSAIIAQESRQGRPSSGPMVEAAW